MQARWHTLLRLDEVLLVRIRDWEAPWLTRLMGTFTHLADASSFIAMGMLLFALGGEAGRQAGVLFGVAALSTILVVQCLKRVCKRGRPDHAIHGFVALYQNPDAFSFPSGHTATAFAVAIALAGHGDFLGTLGLVYCIGVGVSRVYLGSHYPLDVLVGAVLGSVMGCAVRSLLI